MIDVNATINTLNGLSAHAGQNDLLKWFNSIGSVKPKVVLTHGENPQREALALQIQKNYNLKSILPELNQVIEI
jgi:metallo-beta-lactamase family protein